MNIKKGIFGPNKISTHLAGRRASLGAITLLKLICFSAGGPFFGCPRMITESPDRTYNYNANKVFNKHPIHYIVCLSDNWTRKIKKK